MALSNEYNFTLEQGATGSLDLLVEYADGTEVDFTGATAECVLRTSPKNGILIATLTSAGGDITLGGSAGTVVVTIPAATTLAMTSGCVYRVKVTFGSGGSETSGTVWWVAKGTIKFEEY
jgi:hypothetical protein